MDLWDNLESTAKDLGDRSIICIAFLSTSRQALGHKVELFLDLLYIED